jgi:hypothetical protein
MPLRMDTPVPEHMWAQHMFLDAPSSPATLPARPMRGAIATHTGGGGTHTRGGVEGGVCRFGGHGSLPGHMAVCGGCWGVERP